MEGEGRVKMLHFEVANVISCAFLKAFKNSKSWIRIRSGSREILKLDPDPDPDPSKITGSDRIRIRNPGYPTTSAV